MRYESANSNAPQDSRELDIRGTRQAGEECRRKFSEGSSLSVAVLLYDTARGSPRRLGWRFIELSPCGLTRHRSCDLQSPLRAWSAHAQRIRCTRTPGTARTTECRSGCRSRCPDPAQIHAALVHACKNGTTAPATAQPASAPVHAPASASSTQSERWTRCTSFLSGSGLLSFPQAPSLHSRLASPGTDPA